MGAASHYLEAAGIPTTGISLVREHTASMQLPRFLWVSFPLGRPFGAPHEAALQKRVLQTALELFERPGGPVLLEDFPEDVPADTDASSNQPAWSCPVAFPAAPDADESELVSAALNELRQLEPWHEIQLEKSRVVPPASGATNEQIIREIGRVAQGAEPTLSDAERPLHEWLRLACDDLRNWYLDAAQGQPGRGSAGQLQDWFWRNTAAARLIAAAARKLIHHQDPMVVMLARRAMVPREHLAELAPEIEPII